MGGLQEAVPLTIGTKTTYQRPAPARLQERISGGHSCVVVRSDKGEFRDRTEFGRIQRWGKHHQSANWISTKIEPIEQMQCISSDDQRGSLSGVLMGHLEYRLHRPLRDRGC